MSARAYTESHPWLTFQFRANKSVLWMNLGEAFSKNQHLAGTPLPPSVASQLSRIYLAKGALGTTAIEGNTLSEDQAHAILADEEKLPPSQEYLERELRNVANALEQIDTSAVNGSQFLITPEWIREQNRRVLDGLELDDHVVPGEYTTRQLVVANYRAAPPEDVPLLMDKLCAWLNEWLKPLQNADTNAEDRFVYSFFAATLGHLYLAWIHPFGDGNGRTARLLECAILAHSSVVPWVSSNVLSDFYNRTRTQYYRRLDAASTRGQVEEFVAYSAGGFVDMLREQIGRVQEFQKRLAWTNFVHERFHDEPTGKAKDRRRGLVLSMRTDAPTLKKEIRRLTPELAEAYAGHDEKMISRDFTVLQNLGLVVNVGRNRFIPTIDQLDAFRPIADDWGSARST